MKNTKWSLRDAASVKFAQHRLSLKMFRSGRHFTAARSHE